MMFNMPTLPYAHNALEPVISQATVDFHYGKHLQTYVNNLNNLVPGTAFEGKTLEEIVATAPDGPVFNNAGQVLNHTFYFLQFAPSPARHEPRRHPPRLRQFRQLQERIYSSRHQPLRLWMGLALGRQGW